MSRNIFDIINIRKKKEIQTAEIKCIGCGATLNKAIAKDEAYCPYCNKLIFVENLDKKMIKEIKRVQRILEKQEKEEAKRTKIEERRKKVEAEEQRKQQRDDEVTYIIDALKTKDVEGYLASLNNPDSPNIVRGKHVKHTVIAIDKETKKKNKTIKALSVLAGVGMTAVGSLIIYLLNKYVPKDFATQNHFLRDNLILLAFTTGIGIAGTGFVYGMSSLLMKPEDVRENFELLKAKFSKRKEESEMPDIIIEQDNKTTAAMETLNNQKTGNIIPVEKEQEEEERKQGVMHI